MKSIATCGVLMPIGGAEDKHGERRVLRHFLELCGGKRARVVVMPSASPSAAEVGEAYSTLFRGLGAANVDCLHIQDRREANSQDTLALLKHATGIFMAGGDQLKLLGLIGGTGLANALREAHRCGTHIAGTSAGASAMSRQMISSGRRGSQPVQRMVQMAAGLGLTNFIIDQHFSQRDRMGRLITAVTLNPGSIGLGLDEDTALVMQPNGNWRLVGSGTVTVIDGRGMTFNDMYAAKSHEPFRVDGLDIRVLLAETTTTSPLLL